MELIAYPSALPDGALMVMIDLLRGRDVNKAKAFHVAWHSIGFGAGKFFPDSDPIVPIGVPEFAVSTMSNADMALELEAAQAKGALADGSDLAKFFDWTTLMPILLKVAQLILEKWLKKE